MTGLLLLFQCQVIPAIVGPTVFYGSVYRYPYSVEFKFEFVVVGHDVETVRIKMMPRNDIQLQKFKLRSYITAGRCGKTAMKQNLGITSVLRFLNS